MLVGESTNWLDETTTEEAEFHIRLAGTARTESAASRHWGLVLKLPALTSCV